jgi:hypothetical protein
MPTLASGHGSSTEPGHQAGQNGQDGPVRTGSVPDGDILAWLREQTGTSGQVPGRRKVIEKWALGSTRADRLRQIVINEATNKAPRFDGSTGQPSGPQPVRLGPLDTSDRSRTRNVEVVAGCGPS